MLAIGRCFHVQGLSALGPRRIEVEMASNHCVEGCDSHQNWLCLTCGTSRCSRYNSSHNIAHFNNTGIYRYMEFRYLSLVDCLVL